MIRRVVVVMCVLICILGTTARCEWFFSDVPESHWAYEYVHEMHQDGLVVGFPDGHFKGSEFVTRYQLAVVLARGHGGPKWAFWEYDKSWPYRGIWVLGVDINGYLLKFADVPQKHWAHDSICRLTKTGVFTGCPDGTFKGDKPFTRYELAVVMFRARKAIWSVGEKQADDVEVTPEMIQAAKTLHLPPAIRGKYFSDIPREHWAYEAVEFLQDSDEASVDRQKVSFNGDIPATRYELAVYLDLAAAEALRLSANYIKVETQFERREKKTPTAK